MEKMTKKEMFSYIAEMMKDDNGVVEFCQNEIALLEKKAEKAKAAAAKKKADGDELSMAVEAALSLEDYEPIAVIASKIDGPDITVAKITYRLTQLVKNGKAEKTEITVPSDEDNGKARRIMGYRAV